MPLRRFTLRTVTAASLFALAVIGPGVAKAQTLGPNVSISIVDAPRPQDKWAYAPTTRKIPTGTWVTWSNDGQETHSVTATDGSFDSGDLDPSEGFSWYFDQPGTYQYTCVEHAWMSGRIVVSDPQS
jgi:plastocyanin